jgi:aminoglycoside 6'-N-acetyltransferase I
MVQVHSAARSDAPAWLRMREALWPGHENAWHAEEIEKYFAGALSTPLEVLIATGEHGMAIGFAELSIRPYAEDCETDRVAYLEGWYVEPSSRRLGVGRALVHAAEDWGRRQGCTEFGSDAVLDNEISAVAHRALGFEETAQIRCFRKSLASSGSAEPDRRPIQAPAVDAARELSGQVAESLGQHLERVRQRIHAIVGPLSTDDLWRRPYPYGNSIGHLLLHLTGNLSYYIGTQIADTGYVRNRPLEFADPSRPAKEQTLDRFDRAVDMVLGTLASQSDADWLASYHGVGSEDVKDRLSMFVRCVAHADHHAGQMIYLVKELARG